MSGTVEQAVLTAPDISCGHCVATVTKAVGSLSGVEGVEANEETKEVCVAYDPNRVSVAAIREALDEAGYPATT